MPQFTGYQPGVTNEKLVSQGGQFSTAVGQAAIAAGVVVIKPTAGRLCQVLITIATTASQPITFYDNSSAGSGTVIGIVPGGTTAGTLIQMFAPAQSGITIGQNASLAAGAITVFWV